MSNELAQLENKIIEAFKDIPYPGDDNIVSYYDYWGYEYSDIRIFFSGKSWRDINLHTLINDYSGDHSACLRLMSPEAFRYYLPSYMLICIRDFEEADATYCSTISKLTREHKSAYDEKWFDKRFACLSDDIKKVIAEFVWTMHVLHGSEWWTLELKAFQSYWHQYYTPDVPPERN